MQKSINEIISFTQNNKLSIFSFMVAGVFLIAALCACSAVNQFFGLSDDNIAEELIEEEMQLHTGLDVDLTPASPER